MAVELNCSRTFRLRRFKGLDHLIRVFNLLVRGGKYCVADADLAACLAPGGRSAQYFLGPRARETGFTAKLGPEAYVYFDAEELGPLHARCGLAVREVVPWPVGHVVVSEPAGEGTA